jgi:PAS domain S-box-containing protein
LLQKNNYKFAYFVFITMAVALLPLTVFARNNIIVTYIINHKLIITAILLAILLFITFQLYVVNKQFRTLIKQKLSTNEYNNSLKTDKVFHKKIEQFRIAFIIGLVSLFIFVLFTYQYYQNPNTVKCLATAIFILNVVGSYLFGNFNRSRQTLHLLSRLANETAKRDQAKDGLLATQTRQHQQASSLASLATLQLNKRTMPKVFFRQLIRQSAETLGVSSVGIWLLTPDKTHIVCESNYDVESRKYHVLPTMEVGNFPSFFEVLKQDRVLAINSVKHHPEIAHIYGAENNMPDADALLIVSIWLKDELLGFVSHRDIGGVRKWTIDEQNYAASLTDLLRLSMESHRRQLVETELSEQQLNIDAIVDRKISLIENNANLFRFIVQRAPISIVYLNSANEIIELNPETEQMLGCVRREVIGKNYVNTFIAEGSKKYYERAMHTILNGNKVVGQELTLVTDKGQPIEVSLSASMELDSEDQPAILLISQDITQQKLLHNSLNRAREAAENADRTKTMFVASMSHELRTPLNSVIGFIHIVLNGLSGELNIKQKEQLSRAYFSAKHLLALVSDVIDISKIEAGFIELSTQEVNVSELLNETEHAVSHLLSEKKLILTIDCPPDLIILTDKKRLYQVVLNLISNALKYTEIGQVDVYTSADDALLTIAVCDTGIGISDTDLKKIFMPFERAESELKIKTTGTGLGLYLTHKILTTQLNGGITVESKVGKGSIFTITLPLNIQLPTKNTMTT